MNRLLAQLRSVPVLVVLLVGLAGTLLVWTVTRRALEADLKQQFETATIRVVLRMHAAMDRPLAQLEGLLGLHAADGAVNGHDWEEFSALIGAASGDTLLSCLKISISNDESGRVVCGPPQRSPEASALQELRETLVMAERSRRPQLSPLIAGLGGDRRQAIALVAPVMRMDGAGVEKVTRWVAIVLDPEPLVKDAIEPIASEIKVAVFDGREREAGNCYYGIEVLAETGPLVEEVPVRLGGRDLWLRVAPGPEFMARHRTAAPATVLTTGLLMTAVTLLTVVMVNRSREAALILSRLNAEREAEAQRVRGATESAAAAKDRFIAMMSHELRTPLTAIMGHTETMLNELLSPSERGESLRTLDRNAQHLLRLLNELLDFSKLDAGAMTVEQVPCSIVRTIEDAAGLLRMSARGKGLEIATEYTFPLPALVRTDPVRLYQIMVNILGNAVKFTTAGVIQVRVSAEGPERSRRLRIDVIDQGMGIDPSHLPNIFEPFYQGDATMARRFGGTGLGLPISRELARLLGGELSVQSSPGKGSTFTVHLPLEPADGRLIRTVHEGMDCGEATITSHADGLRGRILLVDDSADNRRLLAHWLDRAGAQVVEAGDGKEAVHLMGAGAAAGPVDMVLMDLQMPVMDGCEAAAAMRKLGYAGPIVALTANTAEGDRGRSLRAGCDDHLHKPIDREELIRACALWLRRARISSAA